MPTFKLVLVGDGGTGKVSRIYFGSMNCGGAFYPSFRSAERSLLSKVDMKSNLISKTDHFRQAPFDRRVREEVHRHIGC